MIRYYVFITLGVASGIVNSILVFILSYKQFGEWWTYPAVVTGATGIVFGYKRLKMDYHDLRRYLGELG